MDNIIFEKIMHDEDDFIAINVTAVSELAMAEVAEKVKKYIGPPLVLEQAAN